MTLPEIPDNRLAGFLDKAVTAARRAAEFLHHRFDAPHTVHRKGAIDLVTEADVGSEAIIAEALGQEIAILAEEGGKTSGSGDEAECVWVIDPLDGTTNYAHGFPWFAVSIALLEENRPLVGVIANVMFQELYCAVRGHGAWCNGKPIQVSQTATVGDSLLATGFPYDVHERPEPVLAALGRVLPRARGVRRAGAAALDLALVACGRLDGFWEIKLKPWDTAAGMLLVAEAGGKLSDFAANDYSPFLPEILATNGRIHDELLNLVAGR